MAFRKWKNLLVLLVLTGCGADNSSTADSAADDQVARGEALFAEHCAQCHPRGGRGDYLKRIPATLLVRRSEIELVEWIQGSDKHREMPNFSYLSDREKQDLASYLLSQLEPRR